jgi:hypothetical protein
MMNEDKFNKMVAGYQQLHKYACEYIRDHFEIRPQNSVSFNIVNLGFDSTDVAFFSAFDFMGIYTILIDWNDFNESGENIYAVKADDTMAEYSEEFYKEMKEK